MSTQTKVPLEQLAQRAADEAVKIASARCPKLNEYIEDVAQLLRSGSGASPISHADAWDVNLLADAIELTYKRLRRLDSR